MMTKLLLSFLPILALASPSCAPVTGSPGCLLLYSDTSSGQELFGYKKPEQFTIRAKYLAAYSDSLCQMALVLDKQQGWIGIDQNDRLVLVPYIYDNGPDYVSEELFRFVENGKMGFANLEGTKVIPAQFDFVTPFQDGYAEYFMGGEKIYKNGKTEKQIIAESGHEGLQDLHWIWGGKVKETGFLNKQGQRFSKKPANDISK